MQTIAITGGTGFIGSALCESLSAAGFRPRLLVRSPRRVAKLEARGYETVLGSLSSASALEILCEGVGGVIHCAGTVRGRTLDDFVSVNCEGARHLAKVLSQSGRCVPMLMFSSLAAREPQLSHYARSKRMAEEMLVDEFPGLPWTVLRPPAVYGPGDRELLPLFRMMARGWALTPGPPENRVSLVHVRDIADATLAWLRFPGQRDRLRDVFPVSDPSVNGYSWREVAATVGEAVGREVRLRRAPAPLLNAVAALNLALSGFMGYAPMLTPGKVRELQHHDWVCNTRRLSHLLSWEPGIALDQGVGPLVRDK